LRIRFGSAPIVPRFVSCYLRQPQIIELILGMAVGTTMPNLNTSILESVPITLPPLPIQQRIAEILGRLDDKMEVNRRTNRTLEAMAQALYQHWFVDFGPFQEGEFVESELGPIPVGWEVKPLSSQIELLSGGTPRTSVEEYWNGDIDWVAASDVAASAPFIMKTERTITPLGVKKSSTNLLPAFTTVITARGTVGDCGMLSRKMAMNQTNYGVRGRDSSVISQRT
jgi:type I restriction enzyme, S subunit